MTARANGRVFVDVGMSLDGLIAGPNGRPGNPLGEGVRLFDGGRDLPALEITAVRPASQVNAPVLPRGAIGDDR